jgi:hypothetical protein
MNAGTGDAVLADADGKATAPTAASAIADSQRRIEVHSFWECSSVCHEPRSRQAVAL